MVGRERAHELLCGSFIFYKALGHAERNLAADGALRKCRKQSALSLGVRGRSPIEIGPLRKSAIDGINNKTELFAEGVNRIGSYEYSVIFEQEHIAVPARPRLESKHSVAAELGKYIAWSALLNPDEIAVYHFFATLSPPFEQVSPFISAGCRCRT